MDIETEKKKGFSTSLNWSFISSNFRVSEREKENCNKKIEKEKEIQINRAKKIPGHDFISVHIRSCRLVRTKPKTKKKLK